MLSYTNYYQQLDAKDFLPYDCIIYLDQPLSLLKTALLSDVLKVLPITVESNPESYHAHLYCLNCANKLF